MHHGINGEDECHHENNSGYDKYPGFSRIEITLPIPVSLNAESSRHGALQNTQKTNFAFITHVLLLYCEMLNDVSSINEFPVYIIS